MKLSLLPWIILFFNQAIGQPGIPDSMTRRTGQVAVKRAVSQYHDFMGTQSLLYNGAAFTSYDPSIKGHAFFETDSLRKGSVLFDGIWYDSIRMVYDIIADKLVIANPYGNYLHPVPEKVGKFLLGGHTFIRTPKGYYDLLCSGPLEIRAKRFKQIEEYSSVQELTRTATEIDRFYVVKGDVYQPLVNVRSLLKLMGDKKGTVRQYLRKNKISLRKNRELAIIKAADYYNQLPR